MKFVNLLLIFAVQLFFKIFKIGEFNFQNTFLQKKVIKYILSEIHVKKVFKLKFKFQKYITSRQNLCHLHGISS